MSLEAFNIFAGSWPIAFMFLVLVIGIVAIYITRAVRESDKEDKAVRAANAVVVRERHDY